jgi:hypothetical protein
VSRRTSSVPEVVPGDVTICERQDYPCWGKATVGRREIRGHMSGGWECGVGMGVAVELPDATLWIPRPHMVTPEIECFESGRRARTMRIPD